MRGDVLIRSGVYGTNTTEGEQKSRRGGGGFSGERSRPFKSGMHQVRLPHTDRVLTGPRYYASREDPLCENQDQTSVG